MPVLIAAPSSELDICLPLAERLLGDGGEVRCYLEEELHDLRQMGCKVAVGELDDDVNLEAALTNVHTYIPLLPDPAGLTDQSSLEDVRRIGLAGAAAAKAAAVPQTILPMPSVVRTETPMGLVFGEVRAAFQEVHALCTIIHGLLWGPHRPLARVHIGNPELKVSVLAVEDLVAALAAADDREDYTAELELGGHATDLSSLGLGEGPRANDTLIQALGADLVLGNSAVNQLGVVTTELAPVRSD